MCAASFRTPTSSHFKRDPPRYKSVRQSTNPPAELVNPPFERHVGPIPSTIVLDIPIIPKGQAVLRPDEGNSAP